MQAETGGVITGGLAKTVVVLALIGVALFDFGAVTVNALQLDDIAGSTLRLARQSYAETGRIEATTEAVQARLEREDEVRLEELAVDDGELVLTLGRPSATLLTHRIPPLEPHTHRTVTKRAPLP